MPPLGAEHLRPVKSQAELLAEEAVAEKSAEVAARAWGALPSERPKKSRGPLMSARAIYQTPEQKEAGNSQVTRAWLEAKNDFGTQVVEVHTDMVVRDPEDPTKATAYADRGQSRQFVIDDSVRIRTGFTTDEELAILGDIEETIAQIEVANAVQAIREA